jgi:putative endonuclease
MSGKDTYCVYLLECRDGSYYCGITTDMELRLRQHNAGTASRYTRGRVPVSVVAHTPHCFSKSAALKLEYAVKKCPRRRKPALVAAAQPADGPE